MFAIGAFFGRRQIADAAHGLYRAAVVQARQADFYAVYGVPDSVDGRFDLLALHVFLLLHRLGGAGREAKVLSQAVFDLMFSDMDQNLREMGVADVGVGRRIKAMATALYATAAADVDGGGDGSEYVPGGNGGGGSEGALGCNDDDDGGRLMEM